MPLLVNPWKRAPRDKEPEQPEEAQEAEEESSGINLSRNRLVVLRQAEGAFAYRLHAFPDIDAAAEYARADLLPQSQPSAVITFWALHWRPETEDSRDPAEAVVIVRDPQRDDIIQIYSFVDMGAAYEFIREEFRNGIDLSLLFVFWASHVDLATPTGPPPEPEPQRAYFAMPTLARRNSERPAEVDPTYVAAATTMPAEEHTGKQGPDSNGGQKEPGSAETPASDLSLLDDLKRRTAILIDEIQAWPGWNGLVPLMFEAATLKEEVYEEAYRDPHAMGRARLIIALSILAAGIGASRAGIDSVALHMVAAAFAWAAYAGVIYGFGNVGFGGRTGPKPWNQLVQTLGLATVPSLLFIFGIIPVYGPIPILAAFFWMFLATVHAISPPLNIDRQSAVVTAAVGCLTFFAFARVAPLVLS
jgi:hypothetical protein